MTHTLVVVDGPPQSGRSALARAVAGRLVGARGRPEDILVRHGAYPTVADGAKLAAVYLENLARSSVGFVVFDGSWLHEEARGSRRLGRHLVDALDAEAAIRGATIALALPPRAWCEVHWRDRHEAAYAARECELEETYGRFATRAAGWQRALGDRFALFDPSRETADGAARRIVP